MCKWGTFATIFSKVRCAKFGHNVFFQYIRYCTITKVLRKSTQYPSCVCFTFSLFKRYILVYKKSSSDPYNRLIWSELICISLCTKSQQFSNFFVDSEGKGFIKKFFINFKKINTKELRLATCQRGPYCHSRMLQ